MSPHLPLVLFFCKNAEKIAFFQETLKGTFSVIVVKDCTEVFDWLKNSPIEILFLDYPSVLKSLEEVCFGAQKLTKGKNLPILLIANSLQKNFILDCLQTGITDFLHEPLQASEIHERITICLHGRLISKKMRIVRNKIKPSSLVPRNVNMLQEKTLLRDATLKTITAAKKGAIPLSVLLIHLDNLSKLQDDLGTTSLEEVIAFIEKFLKNRLRKYDTFLIEAPGQYLILLPKTSQSAARAIAEDISKEISTTTIKTHAREALVTVSIGIVSFEKELSKSAKDFEQFDLCLEKTKKSLLRAQKKGNTII